MSYRIRGAVVLLVGLMLLLMSERPVVGQSGGSPDTKFADFEAATKGAKTYEGMLKLYQKGETVYAELKPGQLDRQFLLPIAVAKGGGIGGNTLNFEEQWVLSFKRVGDKVHLIRRNVRYTAKPGSPTSRAVDVTYSDSVLLALRIVGVNPMTQGVLINFNDIFMSNFGEFNLGRFDPNRSVWHKIKAFPRNIELQIEATFVGGTPGDAVIDNRGTTVIVHYGLAELPDGGYQTRIADPRVGHFVTALKDFSSESKDTSFIRYVNRWRLEPAEPVVPGRLSVPKRSIKFYIEKSVPHEYRAAVQDGILEWNKAFEKIGFRNAIEVVQQRDDEEFDPEDMNYNTFRWITTDTAYAMGPSRANPFTGEILDADIIFDGDFIRYWKQERQILRSNGREFLPVSPIQAMDEGWGLPQGMLERPSTPQQGSGWNDTPQDDPFALRELRTRAIRAGVCQCGTHMKRELSMAAVAMLEIAMADDPQQGPKKTDSAKKDELIDQLLQQAVKEVVMHEVGHTLGLRHNFKASTMLTQQQLHDTKITREKGLVASVMDYTPVNLAPKGVKQGDFFTTTLGPYDYWAIEYAYKPNVNDQELKKIAARGAESPDLVYGTDEDTFLTSDPLINRFDLGQDVVRFAMERMQLTDDLLKTLSTRVVEEGEGYQRLRVAFDTLLNQYGNGAYLIARHVGGEQAFRDHRNDPKGRDPLVPITPAKQREALKFLQEKIFTDASFQYPPELLRKLAVERWLHWGTNPESTDFPIHERILGIQRVALNQLLSPATLARIQSTELKLDADAKGDKAVSLGEVFTTLTNSIWSDLPGEKAKDHKSSVVRRNLQREHVRKLTSMVVGEAESPLLLSFGLSPRSASLPQDARSLARANLKEIVRKIEGALKSNLSDAVTRAHLDEIKERITKVLDATVQIRN